MNGRRLPREERAVSSVLVAATVVALTITVAAVIGTVVLGIGAELTTTTPETSFEYAVGDDGDLVVTHDGGDAIDRSQVAVTVDGTPVYDGGAAAEGWAVADDWPDSVTEGDRLRIEVDGASINRDATVRVLYRGADGERIVDER